MKLLQANHCTKTLAYIDATEKTDQVASRYACVDQHKKRYFSVKPGDMCKALPLERDWQNFTITPDVVVDILPSKMVVDQDGAKKLWVQFYMANTSQTEDRTLRYNQLKSLNRYYCKQRQTILVQGTYRLDGRVVRERMADAAIVEEIEPGTISDAILSRICN